MIIGEKENSSRQIQKGAIMSYITIVFNIIAGLIYTPWLISQIGASDYGLFTLATSLIGLLVMDFGLGAAVSRFVTKYIAEKNEDKIKDFLGITFKLYLIIDSIIFILLVGMFFSINNIYVELTPLEIEKLKIIFCISGLFSVISFPFIPLNGIIIAHEKFIFIKQCELFNKIATIILMIIALILGYGLYAIVIVNVFVGLVLIAFKLTYIKRNTKVKINFKCKDKIILKEIFGFSLWTTVMNIAGRCIMNITPTVLGILSGSNQIAIFSIGMAIEGYTFTFANALNGLFLPKLSRMITKKTAKEEIEKLMIKVGRIQLFIVGLILIGFITLGSDFISLWMGENFKDSYWVAVFLIIPCFITLTQEIANTMIVVVNKVKERSLIHIFTAFVSIILSIILSPIYGAVGSAFAIGVALILGNVIFTNIFYYKYLDINIMKFFKECHFKMCAPLFLVFIVGVILQRYIITLNWIIFACKVILVGLTYLILMWNMALNDYEKNLFKEIIKKLFKRYRM